MLHPSVGAFKIGAHLQGYFISLHFHHLSIHWKSVLSSMAKPFIQVVFHVAMFCTTNPHVLQNIVPLQSLMFSRIPFFFFKYEVWQKSNETNFLLTILITFLPHLVCCQCGHWDSISLGHFTSFLSFLSTSLLTTCYCLAHVLSLLCTHTFCTVWNNQFKIQLCDTCHDTSHCTKHALCSPWLSQHAAPHVTTHACFMRFCSPTDNGNLMAEGISGDEESTCCWVFLTKYHFYAKIILNNQIIVSVGQENYFKLKIYCIFNQIKLQ